jgi:hypothetical protein
VAQYDAGKATAGGSLGSECLCVDTIALSLSSFVPSHSSAAPRNREAQIR